ncbi:adenosine deaminase [bacterium]|nr:adenosine deaminase [bacterium]
MMLQTFADSDWFDRVPKVELHLHLEGAIPLNTLWELLQKYGGDPEVPDMDALRRLFKYVDFPQFIKTWVWKNQYVREYEDFTFIGEAVARELVRMNVRYAEVFYSAPDFFRHGLTTQGITKAIRKGLNFVPDVEIALIADLVRDFGPEKAEITLREVAEVSELGVIGIGLGGSEQDFPPELFERVFEEARRLGFRTCAHAGEAAGPSSIWGVINVLKVDRIGHGTRALEDPKLIEFLTQSGIPLEVCPTSNICTGVVARMADHPVRKYQNQGISITINTDDPVMFDTTLAEEYRALVDELDFSRSEIRKLILNGISCSWLPTDRKEKLQKLFSSDPNWQS